MAAISLWTQRGSEKGIVLDMFSLVYICLPHHNNNNINIIFFNIARDFAILIWDGLEMRLKINNHKHCNNMYSVIILLLLCSTHNSN